MKKSQATVNAKRHESPTSSRGAATPKHIYKFGDGKAEGRSDMKQLLGGKGANLAEMTNLGIPVPPGLTITTAVCREFYDLDRTWPAGLDAELKEQMRWLESVTKKGFGDPKKPLLVSVRSGAPVSMPGMMDTILNLGLNDRTVEGLIAKTGNPRFAYDAYRRFIQMYGNVVLEMEHHLFEDRLKAARDRCGVATDAELPTDALQALVKAYKQVVQDAKGAPFPEDPIEQLHGSINAVFSSWNNDRANIYRRLNNIDGAMGTAVNVQSMVFGNMGEKSLTGVCFTRDPSTGEHVFYGEYLVNAQGEDVVAGIRTPLPVAKLQEAFPKIYDQLLQLGQQLERYFKEVQDLEFTVEEGTLFILQTRTGKRTASAAIGIVADFVKEGLISRDEALLRVDPEQIDQLLHPTIDPKAKTTPIAKGLPASPGAAVGKVVFEAKRAVELVEQSQGPVILVRQETSPEDIEGMAAAEGILTARGGMTCVSGPTTLLTPRGFVTAQGLFDAIRGGDRPLLLAFDHRSMCTRWRRVMATGRRRAGTVEIDLSQTGRARGNTLEVTSDHKMFTVVQRKLIKKPLSACLADGDFLCVTDRVPAWSEAPLFPQVDPYLVGAILTDGCIRLWERKGSVTFTQKPEPSKLALISAVQQRFEESFGYPLGYQRDRTTSSVLRGRAITGVARDVISFRRGAAEQLAGLRDAIVPWILQLEDEALLKFLAGVVDGDGTYSDGRLQLYIGKEALLQGVTLACLRLGIAPQVTRNRTISNVQVVEHIDEILAHTTRVHGSLPPRKYGPKFFSIRALFGDVVSVVDRQGRVGSAVKRNVLYGDSAIREHVLPRCPAILRTQVQRFLDGDLRMVRARRTGVHDTTWVYNFEVLAEDELDKNFVAFSRQYTPVLVSNSHAAVVARGMGKCCVVGCSEITVRVQEQQFRTGDTVVKELDFVTLNGTTGEVMLGQVPLVQPQLTSSFKHVLEWADQTRRLAVRANADTPHDAKIAREFGAEGIGLCRTEHMFFGEDRLPAVREMILAKNVDARKVALAKLLPFQRQDFLDILHVMEGLPVTIRLLDPPLHEFLPHTAEDIRRLAEQAGIDERELTETVESLKEINPMLGHRGCRLGLTYPEINEMQAQAIFEAACELTKAGVRVEPEVMIPLVGHPQEFRIAKQVIDRVARETFQRYDVTVKYLVGTMIEVPRAAVVADELAKDAEFFSFGTNDLTQMTFAFSRDDIAKFLPHYLHEGILPCDPFVKLDQVGVGALVKMGVQKGRAARKRLKVGICGEHGGDPSSVEFFHRAGLDYVSCSPYRVPVARMAAAQAVLREKKSS